MAITSSGHEAVSIFIPGDQCSEEVINLGLSQKNKRKMANLFGKHKDCKVNYKSCVCIFIHNKVLMDSREHRVYFSLSEMGTPINSNSYLVQPHISSWKTMLQYS